MSSINLYEDEKTDSISFADIIGRFCIRTVGNSFRYIRRAPSTNIKEFGGFLLDMGLMNVATPELPKFNLEMPNMTKDYNQLFRLNTDVTYRKDSLTLFLRLLSLVFLALATDMVGDCPLLHSLCRWGLSN